MKPSRAVEFTVSSVLRNGSKAKRVKDGRVYDVDRSFWSAKPGMETFLRSKRALVEQANQLDSVKSHQSHHLLLASAM